MGIFDFFSSEISNKKIDDKVFGHFQLLGPPKNLGMEKHKEKFLSMLVSLNDWAKENKFGDWKRSAISGSIENILRTSYENTGNDQIVQEYVNLSRKIILDLSNDYNW